MSWSYADGSEELYNHREDPYEWTNLAADARFAAVKQRLSAVVPEKEADDAPRSEQGTGAKPRGKDLPQSTPRQ
ncbi:MAG: hypothetical protein GXY83_29395 [Rhodopirellula sp.]|nr:hypothetical protein [Rhodopirellula sp.]